jgi:hypothetical protein
MGGVSRRRCCKCNKPSSEVTARCVPYYKTAVGDGTSHIRSIIPSLCDKCGKEEIIGDDEDVIGMLTASYAKQYKAAKARSGHHMQELIVNGLTVISDGQLRGLMQNLAEGQLWPHMFSVKDNESRPLKHNGRSDTKTTTEIGTDKEEKESPSYHPARRWVNLFHLDERGGRNTTINNQMLSLETLLGKILFPDEYYASMAVSYGKGWNGDMSEWEGRDGEINEIYQRSLLKVQDVNALIKGPSLNEAQSPHVDGTGLKLVVISVDTCSGDGYEFCYIEGSHALMREHEDYAKRTRLPMKDMTTIRVQEGHCIVFWESLVHGGGAASTCNPLVGDAAARATERYTSLGSKGFKFFGGNDTTTLPSDLSFQFTRRSPFRFYGAQSHKHLV